MCIILILLTSAFLSPTLKGQDVCNGYKVYYCLAISHNGELYSVFVIAFTACIVSHSGLLCSVIRQVEHRCWCNSAVCSVSVDQLRSSFVYDILPCCWVFGVWHFDTACQYHSPTNTTLYSWTGKISCYFLHDSVLFSQNQSFSILCTYLVVIIHSTCSADITTGISLCLVISWLVLLVSSPPWWYDMIHLLTAVGFSPCTSSTVHIYTQTIHRTTQLTSEECRLCPVFASYILTTEEKAWKYLTEWKQNIQNRTFVTIRIQTHKNKNI